MAPITLVSASGIMTRREISRCFQYAPVLAVVPTHSATVLVALAVMGATPLNIRAGKAMKLPPPATAFSAPPRAAATNRKIAVCRPKYKVVSRGGELRETCVLPYSRCETLVIHSAVLQILRGGVVPIMNLDLLDFPILVQGGSQVSVNAGKICWQVELFIAGQHLVA